MFVSIQYTSLLLLLLNLFVSILFFFDATVNEIVFLN